MAWIESNLERMRSITGTAQKMADRGVAQREASKDRLFTGVENLVSGLQERREANRQREHEGQMQADRYAAEGELQAQRDEAAMKRLKETHNWNDEQRIAAEKAIEGMPDWDPNLYSGSWTDHNGKLWEWSNKQEYDLIKQDIMNEAAERAAAARNEKPDTEWWPAYEKVSADMMRNRTDIWDPETGEFAGWQSVGEKEALIDQFRRGINQGNLSPEQQEAAVAYFTSYLQDIEDGNLSATVTEGEDGIEIIPPTTYSKQPIEGHLQTITPLSGSSPQVKPTYQESGGGSRLAPEPEQVSSTVESFWDKLNQLATVEPEQTIPQKAAGALFRGGGMGDEVSSLWNTMQAVIPTLTKEDVSLLSDSEELQMRRLILSGVNDSKMSKGELETFMDLVEKINEKKAERSGIYNP